MSIEISALGVGSASAVTLSAPAEVGAADRGARSSLPHRAAAPAPAPLQQWLEKFSRSLDVTALPFACCCLDTKVALNPCPAGRQ